MHVDLKKELLSISRPYAGYKVHISADPMAWSHPFSEEQAHQFARQVAVRARHLFPGICTDISLNPNNFPSGGEDQDVLETLDSWLAFQRP